MKALVSIQQAFAGSVKGVKIGACLALLGFGGVVGSSAQAQASSSATANLTLNLTVTASSNPYSCSVGSTSASSSTSQSYTLTSETQSSSATYLTGSYTSTNGFPIYCATTFTVSAGGGLNAANTGISFADSDLTRYLFLSGSSSASIKYAYGLFLGSANPAAVTGTTSYPTWSGAGSTCSNIAYTGATAVSGVSSGGTVGSVTAGCYKSTTITAGTATQVYIPWGYYVSAPSGWINSGTFTDTVALSLNY